jgi:hypothetical protein
MSPSIKLPLTTIAVSLGVALAGCGGGGNSSVPVSAKLERVPGSKKVQIVLSQLGAQRIGIQTGSAVRLPSPRHAAARQATVVIPYSAVVYDPTGATVAFTRVAPLRYQEVPITIDRIVGNTAYLVKGPKAGSAVVSVGAEELYGVQAGVLAQT